MDAEKLYLGCIGFDDGAEPGHVEKTMHVIECWFTNNTVWLVRKSKWVNNKNRKCAIILTTQVQSQKIIVYYHSVTDCVYNSHTWKESQLQWVVGAVCGKYFGHRACEGEMVVGSVGNHGTGFVINISMQENQTWQGTVRCGQGDELKFRSALEMLKFMDSAMEPAADSKAAVDEEITPGLV